MSSSAGAAPAQLSETPAHDPDADTPPAESRLQRVLHTITTPSFVALAAPVLLLFVMGWVNRWVADDGWINVRVVEQFFAGHGPVFNKGERVELTTSTLWFWMLLACQVLFPWQEVQISGANLGLLLSCWSLVAATLGARELIRHRTYRLVLPLGTLMVAVLPPFWDFATSGLETGLSFSWIATGFWLLARRINPERISPFARRWPILPMVLFGLGPLVRPDLALYSVLYVVALLLTNPRNWVRFVISGLIGCIVPVAYEVWRMGYYGLLVPNTALAKDASSKQWEQGFIYLVNYAGLYVLLAPVLICGFGVVAQLRLARSEHSIARTAVVLAPVVAALLHTFYVVRVGGDFMHGRFLLPPTMAIMLPAAVIGIGRRERQLAIAATAFMCGWAVTVAGGVRPSIADFTKTNGIANERYFWVDKNRTHKALTRHDWFASPNGDDGLHARWNHEAGWSYYAGADGQRHRTTNGKDIYITHLNMGILSVAAGPEVRVLDELALADGITSHAKFDPRLESTERVGHHPRPEAWRAARYAVSWDQEPPDVTNARIAMGCGDLAELQRAITQKMTKKRFLQNIRMAPRLTRFTFPAEPEQARLQLCGWAPGN